jgi:hypothetical protein
MPSSRAGRAAYITLQMNCLLFMLNSGFGSFQNQFSIEMLFGKIPTLELDSTCEATQSSETKIIIAHLIALYAAYSAIKSYRSSNLLRLRQYYIRYILQGEWRQFGFRSYFEALMTTGLYTRSIAFNTKHTWELLEKNSLCHIPLDLIPVPSGVILGHTLESCAVNVTTNFGSALAAAHKRNTNRTVVELSALLENAPRWRFWDKFIRVCFYITALSTSTGTFTALVDGTYEYWVIALAVIAALFSGRNQLSTSYEAYIQQLEMRSANPDLLQAALLEEADVEAVQNDDVESPAENYLPPAINDRLSVAPSATLFGISNPANLAAQPLSPTTTIDVKADIIPADPISPPVPQ